MALPASHDEMLLLHNPRCSKSRATLALLQEKGAKFETRLYLEDALSRAELDDLRGRLGRPASEWVRKGEEPFEAAGLSLDAGDEALLQAMSEHPILVERPILVRGSRAIVGRPPEDVLELL